MRTLFPLAILKALAWVVYPWLLVLVKVVRCFRPRLEGRVGSNLATIYFYRVANGHLPASKCFYGFVA